MYNYSQHTDDLLVQFISTGDADAFTELYNRYKDKLYNFAFKLTNCPDKSKDIVHNIFLKIWEKRDLLDGKVIFSSYLFMMIRNHSIDELRKWAKEKVMIDEIAKRSNTIELNTPEENLIYRELDGNINLAIERLPARQKQILELHLLGRLKHQEVANQLNLSISTVENTFGRSMASIRRQLKDGLL